MLYQNVYILTPAYQSAFIAPPARKGQNHKLSTFYPQLTQEEQLVVTFLSSFTHLTFFVTEKNHTYIRSSCKLHTERLGFKPANQWSLLQGKITSDSPSVWSWLSHIWTLLNLAPIIKMLDTHCFMSSSSHEDIVKVHVCLNDLLINPRERICDFTIMQSPRTKLDIKK